MGPDGKGQRLGKGVCIFSYPENNEEQPDQSVLQKMKFWKPERVIGGGLGGQWDTHTYSHILEKKKKRAFSGTLLHAWCSPGQMPLTPPHEPNDRCRFAHLQDKESKRVGAAV